MRPAYAWLILVAAGVGVAGTGMAQWRHFGEESPAAAPVAENKPVVRQPPARGLYSMAREMVASHNAVRATVGTAPLIWSESLAIVAQNWADHLMANGKFEHSHNPNYGENLYEIMGAPATPAQAIKAFADEVKDYNYRSNSCRTGAMCGHYTQVVWNDTKEVGCAVARGGGREVWVCEYSPPGNWVGGSRIRRMAGDKIACPTGRHRPKAYSTEQRRRKRLRYNTGYFPFITKA